MIVSDGMKGTGKDMEYTIPSLQQCVCVCVWGGGGGKYFPYTVWQ
jgi:hypothetical protein